MVSDLILVLTTKGRKWSEMVLLVEGGYWVREDKPQVQVSVRLSRATFYTEVILSLEISSFSGSQ